MNGRSSIGRPRCDPALGTIDRKATLVRTIYVIAHPEATHHVERVVGGWHDSPLTPVGIAAAVSIAHALRAAIPDGAEPEPFDEKPDQIGQDDESEDGNEAQKGADGHDRKNGLRTMKGRRGR